MEPFLLRVALSFALGGLAVALFTTAAERLGSRLGGLLLSFPVKVTIAMILIGLNEGAAFAAQAAVAIPAGLGVNVVFLGATALLVRRVAPWPAIAGALAVWLVAGVVAVLLPPATLAASILMWLAPAGVSLALLARVPGLRGDRKARTSGRFGVAGLVTRAAGAGAIVATSVVLARYAGPVVGGLASVFPSGWITTMVILTRKHGADFTGATTRVMIAGSVAPVAFGAMVAWGYPRLGIALGTLAAMGAAACVSLLVWLALRHRDRASGPRKG